MLQTPDLVDVLAEYLTAPDLLKLQTHDTETRKIVANRLRLLERSDELFDRVKTVPIFGEWPAWQHFRDLIMEGNVKSLDHRAAMLALERLLDHDKTLLSHGRREAMVVNDVIAKDIPLLNRIRQLNPGLYQRIIWFILSRSDIPRNEVIEGMDMRHPSWRGFLFPMNEHPTRVFYNLVRLGNVDQLDAIIDLFQEERPIFDKHADPESAVVSFAISLLLLPSTTQEARGVLRRGVELLESYFPAPNREARGDKLDELFRVLGYMNYLGIHTAGQEDSRDELLSILAEIIIRYKSEAKRANDLIGNHHAPLTRKVLASVG